ncbi:major facilitator superfamily domain-containing protein [Ilyonectria sp. MPI-CAGE-AT-0026]|nr:major facilitator superfamily domain-containing protein [Ilyonectria sp. MPI-CAGE-AT-0026]
MTGTGPKLVTEGAVVTRIPSEPDEKKVANIGSHPTKESDKPKDFPLSWKLTALACGVALSFGSSFAENILGPLKSTLRKELEIDNARYGAISSATSLVNTILPIIGGYGLDYYGVEWGSMACSIAIFIGAVVSAAGSNQDSFSLVLSGRIIMGFGSTVIESCTSKILAHWFQHRGLGLVYGLDLSIGKLIVLIAKATAVPMRDASSFWGWALWIPAIVCFVNLLQNAFYFWWARSRPEWAQIPTGQQVAMEASQRECSRAEGEEAVAPKNTGLRWYTPLTNWKILMHVPRFFWLVVCTQILQAGVVGGFNGLNADIIRLTRGSTDQIAGYTSAVQQVIPVICAPLLGSFFDFFGYRMLFVSVTSAIWILVYCLIGFSHVNALGVMVIASLASAMNALPFLASIPLMVPNQTELGLVFGIWKAFNNSGSVVVDMIAGRLQDVTPGGTYERVVAFFVACKTLEFCLGLFYGVLDRKYLGSILSISEKKRKELEQDGKINETIGHKPGKVFTIAGLSLLCCLVVIAWVLFILYSL